MAKVKAEEPTPLGVVERDGHGPRAVIPLSNPRKPLRSAEKNKVANALNLTWADERWVLSPNAGRRIEGWTAKGCFDR
jgi:hypothetical protein